MYWMVGIGIGVEIHCKGRDIRSLENELVKKGCRELTSWREKRKLSLCVILITIIIIIATSGSRRNYYYYYYYYYYII